MCGLCRTSPLLPGVLLPPVINTQRKNMEKLNTLSQRNTWQLLGYKTRMWPHCCAVASLFGPSMSKHLSELRKEVGAALHKNVLFCCFQQSNVTLKSKKKARLLRDHAMTRSPSRAPAIDVARHEFKDVGLKAY